MRMNLILPKKLRSIPIQLISPHIEIKNDNDEVIGHLRIGSGNLKWLPKGKRVEYALHWKKLLEIMCEQKPDRKKKGSNRDM